jgi:hypothetical protein
VTRKRTPGTFTVGDPRAGRPLGARNKLSSRVLEDLLDVWNEPVSAGSDVTKGKAALRCMAVEEPADFAKLYASLLPKEIGLGRSAAELEANQIDTLIEQLQADLVIEHKVDPRRLEFKPAIDCVDTERGH